MRVLIVDDDPVTATLVKRVFEQDGTNVEVCDTGEEAIDMVKAYDFNGLIVDMNLPDMTGCQLIKRVRTAKVETPLIVISATNDTDLKLQALFSGADDYMAKPFDPRELLARHKAIVRRAHGFSGAEIRVGRVTIDLNSRSVCIDDQRLAVTAKEYSILELLALRKGTTLTKETFLDHLYGGMDEPEQKIIDVFVCKLRKKIARLAQGEQVIETVWGHGYVLKDSPSGQQVAEDPGFFFGESAVLDSDQRLAELEGLLLDIISFPMLDDKGAQSIPSSP